MDTNIFVNLLASTACGAMATAVTLITAEDTDKEVRPAAVDALTANTGVDMLQACLHRLAHRSSRTLCGWECGIVPACLIRLIVAAATAAALRCAAHAD
jgi:hypothetical protein